MHVSRKETVQSVFRKFVLTSLCLVDSSEERAEAETRREITAMGQRDMVRV